MVNSRDYWQNSAAMTLRTPLSQEEFKAEIEQWLTRFVEKPSAALLGWAPCPFARKARVSQRIGYLFVAPDEFEVAIQNQIQTFSDDFEVFVVGTYPDFHSPKQIDDLSQNMRNSYWKNDIWILFDHPADIEEIGGLKMNHGTYLLCMIQRLSKLAKASEQLEAEGYYKTWSEDTKVGMTEGRMKRYRQLGLIQRKSKTFDHD